jgi:hypothetical protein
LNAIKLNLPETGRGLKLAGAEPPVSTSYSYIVGNWCLMPNINSKPFANFKTSELPSESELKQDGRRSLAGWRPSWFNSGSEGTSDVFNKLANGLELIFGIRHQLPMR